MPAEQGKFITLEGTEGAGKSTNLAFILNLVKLAGKPARVTREPGGTPLGEEIRRLVLAPSNPEMSPDTELLLMFAARCEHLERVVRPALEQGIWVLCDRFMDASYAYQGGGRMMGLDRVRALENWLGAGLRPDLTLLLDLPVALGMERARRLAVPDRFESEQQAFFERVRTTYLQLAAHEPERFRLVRADRSLEEVQRQIRAVIETLLASERT
jgi:dTMP kinase